MSFDAAFGTFDYVGVALHISILFGGSVALDCRRKLRQPPYQMGVACHRQNKNPTSMLRRGR
jgi:hypothetical protein